MALSIIDVPNNKYITHWLEVIYEHAFEVNTKQRQNDFFISSVSSSHSFFCNFLSLFRKWRWHIISLIAFLLYLLGILSNKNIIYCDSSDMEMAKVEINKGKINTDLRLWMVCSWSVLNDVELLRMLKI